MTSAFARVVLAGAGIDLVALHERKFVLIQKFDEFNRSALQRLNAHQQRRPLSLLGYLKRADFAASLTATKACARLHRYSDTAFRDP